MTTASGSVTEPARPDGDQAVLRRCPFLTSESGAWVASSSSAAHRCGAVAPPASLSLDKQRRLCLVAAHDQCATFVAAGAARADRIPARARDATPWGWVRTTPVVDARLGIGASLGSILGDRRRWQVVPALLLVVALAGLGLSNIGSAVPSPSAQASDRGAASANVVAASPTAASSGAVPSATSSAAPTPASTSTAIPASTPVSSPTPSPVPSARTTYTVASGDSLYSIALAFGVSWAAIKDLNGLTSTTLHIGQQLLIP